MLAIGISLVCIEVGIMIGIKVLQMKEEKRKEEARINEEVAEPVNYRKLIRLRAAYKHPWLKIRDEIFEYYN